MKKPASDTIPSSTDPRKSLKGPLFAPRSTTLRDADLSHRDLRGADLVDAHLEGVRLAGALLRDVDLSDAHLVDTDIRGADLAGAILDRVVAPSIRGEGAVLARSRMWDVDFEGADLRGADLRDTRLDGARLERALLGAANLSGAHGRGVNLDGAHLDGANLRDASLPGARLTGARLRGAHLENADLRRADFRHSDLRGADLRGALLDGALLDGALLEGAQVEGVRFHRLRIGRRVSGGEIVARLAPEQVEALLRALPGSAWRGDVIAIPRPRITPTWLRAALLLGILRKIPGRFAGVPKAAFGHLGSAFTGLLTQLRLLAGKVIRSPLEGLQPGGALAGRDFSGMYLAQRDLHGADFRGARLVGVDLSGSDLRRADFSGADLSGALLSDACLEGALLADAVLNHAVIRRAILDEACLDQARLVRADLRGSSMRRLKAEGASFVGASLAEVDLTGSNLRASKLDGTDLRDAILDDVLLDGVSFGRGQRVIKVGGDTDRGSQDAERRFARVPLEWLDKATRTWRERWAERSRLREEAEATRWQQEVKAARERQEGAIRHREEVEVPAQEAAAPIVEVPAQEAAAPIVEVPAQAAAAPIVEVPAQEAVTPITRAPVEWASSWPRRWVVGAFAATMLGLGAFLAFRFVDTSSITQSRLEQDATETTDAAEAAARFSELADRAADPKAQATWLLEKASRLDEEDRPDAAILVLEEARALQLTNEDLRVDVILALAAMLLRADRPTDALPLYEGLADDPTLSPERLAQVLVGATDTCTTLGIAQRGTDLVQRVLDRYPDNPEVALAVARRTADALVAHGRISEALDVLDRISDYQLAGPERASWLVARGRLFVELAQADKAIAAFNEALQLLDARDPLALNTNYRLARLRVSQGDLARAMELLRRMEGRDCPTDLQAQILLLEAECFRLQGGFGEAEALYRRVIAENDRDVDLVSEARLGLGLVLVATGDIGSLNGLHASLDRAGTPREAAADVLLGYAQGFVDRGDAKSALETFDRLAVVFTPADRWGQAAASGRATCLVAMGRHTEALDLLRILRSKATGAEALRLDARIGGVLLKSGRLDEARMTFEGLLTVTRGQGPGAMEARLGLGQVAEAQGHVEAAITRYQEVIAVGQDPATQSAALESLAGLYLEQNRYDEALEAYRRYVLLLPLGSPLATTARLSQAEIHARRGDTDAELRLLDEILAQDLSPLGQARARVRKAEIVLRQGQAQVALDAYEALRESGTVPPDLGPDITWGQASALIQLGRAEDALGILETALADPSQGEQEALKDLRNQALTALGRGDEVVAGAAPDDPDADSDIVQVRMAEASMLRDQGRLQAALALYQEMLATLQDRPARASILQEMALTRAQAGDPTSARAALEQVATEFADLPEATFMARFSIAELDLAENDPEAALRRYDALNPPDDGHRLWLLGARARALSTLGRFDEARTTWRQVLEGWPGDPAATTLAWTGIGDLALQQGDSERALAAFQRAADLAPPGASRETALMRVSSVLLTSGKPDEASKVLDEVLKGTTDPEVQVQARLARCGLLQEAGDWQGALKIVKDLDADDLGPGFSAQVADARGVCFLGVGQIGNAEKVYAQLVERWPDSPDARLTSALGLAETAAARGDIEEATRRYEAVAAQAEDRFRQAQALLRLGQLLEMNARPDEARQVFARIVSNYADEPEMAEAARKAME